MKKTVIIGFLLLLAGCAGSGGQDLAPFAKCLTESGAKMYGAYWCPHCTAQKTMFGSSFKDVKYIECSLPNREGQTQVCIDAGISSYPTWEFADGSRLNGAITLSQLSRETGCDL